MARAKQRETVDVELSAQEARLLALSAQGLAGDRPAKATIRHLRAVAKRLHAIQLDTVNALERAHFLPFFSRVGPYPKNALDRLVNEKHELIELLAHQASFVPVELEPLFRPRRGWRSSRWEERLRRLDTERPGYVDAVHRAVGKAGPLRIGDLPDRGEKRNARSAAATVRRKDGLPYSEASLLWWRSSDGKDALDGLLSEGRLVLAGRGPGFERLYDLPERVVPPSVLAMPTPSLPDSRRELVRLAARALGVATIADLADYFMLRIDGTRAATRELVEMGELIPARVEGWKGPAFLDARARMPGSVGGRALLSPFDSLTWSRDRTRRLFDFEFSFEIYVPVKKRRYGYYVLPFLLGERLVARVDLKADRARRVLLVPGAFSEPTARSRAILPALAESLWEMAGWLGLDRIEVGDRGDLAAGLSRAVKKRGRV